MLRTAVYDDFYRASQQLSAEEVHTVIISSRKPRSKTLELFQFEATMQSGVYHCKNVLAERITLISINELDDDLHNVFVKFFATQRKSRSQALNTLRDAGFNATSQAVLSLLTDVWRRQSNVEVNDMPKTMTIEEIEAEREAFVELVLASIPKQALVKQIDLDDLSRYFSPEERLAGLEPEVIEAYLRSLTEKRDSAENP